MGNVARRPNGKYRARFRDGHGVEHARHFKEESAAKAWLQAIEAMSGRLSVLPPELDAAIRDVVVDELYRLVCHPTAIQTEGP